jgi:peptidoglycan/xylan/chitin deacetylase (PgdA/CDA1 family)
MTTLCLAIAGVGGPLLLWPRSEAAPPQAEVRHCTGPLTGRTVTISPDTIGFGQVQSQQPLPLRAGEYVLSIDDGPTPATTPQILGILDRACIKATFFMIGKKAKANPALAQEIVRRGHGVGSHSFTHGNLSLASQQEREDEISSGVEAVELAAYGKPLPPEAPRLFRIPGATGVPQKPPADWMAFLHSRHLVLAGYDFSPQDWRNSLPQESFARLFPAIGDRGVIVMHDWPSNTPALMEMVLAELQKRHAKIVTLRMTGDH